MWSRGACDNNSSNERKSGNGQSRKPKLDKEFKETMKNVRKKLELSTEAAMCLRCLTMITAARMLWFSVVGFAKGLPALVVLHLTGHGFLRYWCGELGRRRAAVLSRRSTQGVDCEVCKSWAAVHQSIARRMLSYLGNSEALKVSTNTLEQHVLAPNEPSVNTMWTVHPQIQHVQSCTAWSHIITRTRVAQELQGSRLHIFVSLKQLSSTCHVSSHALPDTDYKHTFSLTHFIHFSYLNDGLTFAHKLDDPRPTCTLRCSTAEWRINTNPISHRLWAQVGWDRSLWQRSKRAWRPRAQKNWAWQETWDRSVSITGKTCEKLHYWRVWTNLEKLVERCPTSSRRCIPIMTQWSALQTRILKMENYKNMIASPLKMQSRADCESSRMPIALGKPAALLQERGASAKRTQADLGKSLMSSSSQEPSARGKPAALFSIKKRRTRKTIQEFCLQKRWSVKFGKISYRREQRPFAESGTRWNYCSKNTKLNLSIIASVSFRNKLMLKDWNCRTLNTDMLNPDENRFVYKKIYLWRKVLRDTEIRSMHEMERNEKRAQELQVDVVTLQKLSENHEAIQKLTAQFQEMQDHMNSINDSGEFQEAESNYSWRLSYVSSQLAMIPSARSMLSSDKRLLFDTRDTSGLQENVVGNQFSTFDSPRDHPQGLQSCAPQREWGPVPQATGTETLFERDDKQNRDTIPMPTFATEPSTMSSLILEDIPQNSMVDSKDSKFRNCNSTNSPNPQSFLVWNCDSKNQATTCSDFPSEAMVWIKEVEMVDSLRGIEVLAIRFWEEFSTFRDAGREDCFCSEQDHPEFPIQEEGQSLGTESPEGGPFLRGRQIAFVIYDYFRVTGAHDTELDYADLFSVTLHDDYIQEFDTRWGRSSAFHVKDSLRWYPGKSVQVEDTWVWPTQKRVRIVRHGEFIKRYRWPFIKNWRQWWRGVLIRNFDGETLTPGTEELKQEQWSRIERVWVALKDEKGTFYQWKEKGQCSQGDQRSFRHESNDRAQKPDHNAATPSEPSLSRGRSVSKKFPRQK